MVYGDFGDFGWRKNKANSKPILASSPIPKEREEESGLENITNPDTIRVEPE